MVPFKRGIARPEEDVFLVDVVLGKGVMDREVGVDAREMLSHQSIDDAPLPSILSRRAMSRGECEQAGAAKGPAMRLDVTFAAVGGGGGGGLKEDSGECGGAGAGAGAGDFKRDLPRSNTWGEAATPSHAPLTAPSALSRQVSGGWGLGGAAGMTPKLGAGMRRREDIVGTPEYLSPEILLGQEHSFGANTRAHTHTQAHTQTHRHAHTHTHTQHARTRGDVASM